MTKFHTVRFITSDGVNGSFEYVGPWYDMEGFTGFDSKEDAVVHLKEYVEDTEDDSKFVVIEVSVSFVCSITRTETA